LATKLNNLIKKFYSRGKLKDNILLYVKSKKVSIIGYSQAPTVHTGWWVDGYGYHPLATRTTHNYKPEDQEAASLLKEAEIAYKLVDLSYCSFMVRLKARVQRIDETPTLILNNKKIRGIGDIKQALQGTKTQK